MLRLPEIKISMIGPRAVGKTSLLASMYGEMQNIGIKLCTADDLDQGKTREKMDEYIKNLQQIPILEKRPNFFTKIWRAIMLFFGLSHEIKAKKGGLSGTRQQDEFKFIARGRFNEPGLFGWNNVKCELLFTFVDFPGGWFVNYIEQNNNQVKECINASTVLLLAIEANALMKGGIYQSELNEPSKVQNLLTNLELSNTQGVILVLMRGEKYFHNGEIDILMQKAACEYQGLITMLKNKGKSVFLTAIETIGGVEFEDFNNNPNNEFQAKFIKNGKGYRPSNCGIPLWLSSKLALQQIHQQAIPNVNKFLKMLGFDGDAKQQAACESLLQQLVIKIETINKLKFFEL